MRPTTLAITIHVRRSKRPPSQKRHNVEIWPQFPDGAENGIKVKTGTNPHPWPYPTHNAGS